MGDVEFASDEKKSIRLESLQLAVQVSPEGACVDGALCCPVLLCDDFTETPLGYPGSPLGCSEARVSSLNPSHFSPLSGWTQKQGNETLFLFVKKVTGVRYPGNVCQRNRSVVGLPVLGLSPVNMAGETDR